MTLRGSFPDFPVESIVQVLAATRKTGQLEVRAESDTGTLGFAEGRLVSALCGDDGGDAALGGVFALEEGEFEFVHWNEAPQANLSGDLEELLERGVAQRDRIIQDREIIPHDRMRFRLSSRAAEQGEVRITADQWRTLLAVNGERDLRGIARELSVGRLGTLSMLAGLVRGGIVDLVEPARPAASVGDDAGRSDDAARPWQRPHDTPDARPLPPAETSRAEGRAAESQADPARVAAVEREASVDDRLSALSSAPPAPPSADDGEAEAAADPAESQRLAEERRLSEERRKKGLFAGLFRPREEPEAEPVPARDSTWSRAGMLASFANALLDEYSTGEDGSAALDDRMANRLMRVDEQADPIDRALPVVKDRIDVPTLERANMPDRQVAPYLALLVTQLFEDAERTLGRERARRTYRAVQERVLGQEASSLGSELRLPRV